MKWYADLVAFKPRNYEIQHDPQAGFYLYVFEDGKCKCDYLQGTLEMAMKCALDDYGVPLNAWKKIEE